MKTKAELLEKRNTIEEEISKIEKINNDESECIDWCLEIKKSSLEIELNLIDWIISTSKGGMQ
jgi:hypothetical protein